MSIKGFSVGGNVERYDYNSLDNIPSEITIDTVLSRSSTNPVQNKVVTGAINATTDSVTALSGEVSDLKSRIGHLQDDGTMRFSADAFYNRGLDNAGNFNSQKYRVSSRAITTAPSDCTLTPANGFRFYIYVYDESDAISKYGWFSTTYNLAEGTRYKLLIARVTEDTSETANIEEFVNAILVGTYVSALGDSVENLKNENALTGWVSDNVLTNRVSVLDAFPQTSNYAFVIRSGKVSLTGTTNYKYRVGSVVEGHRYHIKTTIGNTAYGYAFADSDDNYLTSDNVHATTEQVEYDVVAPVGASRLYVNARTTSSSEIWEWEKPKEQYKFTLPDYYDGYLQTKLDTIHEMERSYGFNGATYAFITDFHYYANKLNSIPLLERIRERTNAVRLIYGGDSVRALGAESYLLSDNYAVASLLFGVYGTDYSYIFGNHDYTIATGGSWGQGMVSIPIAAVHSIYKKGFSTGIKRNYHYYDDEINEIRHIFIDYTQAGYPWFLEWFRDEALNIPSGWSVAFYCHTPFAANTVEAPSQYMSYLADWICALANKRTYVQTITSTFDGTTYNTDINVDYTASTATVIYAACGHIHKDTLSVVDGVTFFSTTCDAMFQDDGYGRTAGTTDEQAFDVITINKTTKTVNLIRIGAGENRSFTY